MRIQQLDGIRAVAIGLVFCAHGLGLKLGWTGVDLFFVLSGYLITRILWRDRQGERFWSQFYLKRAGRILPPLLLCLALCAIFFQLHLRWLWLAFIFFGGNIAKAFAPAAGGPLSVLWSLAIEEHYYLLWPFAVRFMSYKNLVRLMVIILFLEPVVRAIATPYTHTFMAISLLTPFRLDGLAAGSLLALLLESPKRKAQVTKLSGPLFFVSAAMFAIATLVSPSFELTRNSLSFNSVGYSLVALVAAAGVAYTLLHEDAPVSKILSLKPLTFLGVISYGFYLFHIIILEKLEQLSVFSAETSPITHGRHTMMVAATVVVTTAFSWGSYKFYESPWVRLSHRISSQWKSKDAKHLAGVVEPKSTAIHVL